MRLGTRELIFLLLLLAVPIAAWFFVFQPRNAAVAQAREEIQHRQDKLVKLEAYTANIADLGEEIDKLVGAMELFEQKLPQQREVEVVLRKVWELAARNGLKPKSVRTDKPELDNGVLRQPLRMVIVGDFDGFYRFLQELERLNRITRLPALKLTKVNNDEGQVSAEMTLNVFFEPKTADQGGV